MFQYKIAIALLYIGSFFSTELTAQKWNLAKDKSGVKVYTRKKTGWPLKEFKAITHINTTVDALETTLRDAKNRSKWMHKVSEAKDVKKVSNNLIYTYSRVATPWPVSDRDNVTEYKFKRISNKEAYVYFKNVKGIVSPKAGVVRINKMEGYWHFKELKAGQVKVTQQAVAEAGGSVPAWLANSAVVDAPYYTLYEMKRYVERRK